MDKKLKNVKENSTLQLIILQKEVIMNYNKDITGYENEEEFATYESAKSYLEDEGYTCK